MEEELERVEVVIGFVSGERLVTLRIEPQESISKVKDLVQMEFGYPTQAQNLLLEGTMVEDDGLVRSLPQPLLLSLVLLPFDEGLALHSAAHSGHEAAVRSLLFRVACDPQEVRELLLLAKGTGNHQPIALHRAACEGHLSVCQALTTAAPDSEACSHMLLAQDQPSGRTALHYAAGKGHSAVCCALLTAAPSGEVSSRMLVAQDQPSHETALHRAAKQGHEAVCQALLKFAPTVQVQTELLLAESLQPRTVFVGVAQSGGLIALHCAAAAGHEKALQALLESTPSPEVQTSMLVAIDHQGTTALHKAASRGHEMACQVLLGKAPNMEVLGRMLLATECTQKMALHSAAFFGHNMVCRVLLGSTPDVDVQRGMLMAKDSADNTALDLAVSMNSGRVCSVLLELAPNVEVQREMLGGALSHPVSAAGITTARQTLLDFAASLKVQVRSIEST